MDSMTALDYQDRISSIPDIMFSNRFSKRRSRAKQHVGWLKFESHFKVHHPEFLHSLARQFPLLSPTELHICAMLRESFVSWEIAHKLSITERSVENHRSNIRRKLGLSAEQNLQTFLVGFKSNE
jgi:DNA-binding CsgD family transcriptional regulator